MNKGTRRMWARRVLRAGWFLAPILQAPKLVLTFFFTENNFHERDGNGGYKKKICGVCIFFFFLFSGMFFGFGRTIYSIQHDHKNASSTAIIEAMKDNSCMIEYLPRVKAGQDHPLMYIELEQAKKACEQAKINADSDEEQAKALSKFTKESK